MGAQGNDFTIVKSNSQLKYFLSPFQTFHATPLLIGQNSVHRERFLPDAPAEKICISSWKMTKGAQTCEIRRSGAKLLEGHGAVKEIEQPCYSAC